MQLHELEPGQAFIMPWRPRGAHVGRVLSVGLGSATVHVPKTEDGTWERTNWALATEIVPCSEEDFHAIHGTTGGRMMNRSKVESPVEIVWAVCDELGDDRDAVVAECVRRGVNINTAKTQFYKWRKSR